MFGTLTVPTSHEIAETWLFGSPAVPTHDKPRAITPCHASPVGTRDRRTDRGPRRAIRILASVGDELRESRLESGLSQRRVAVLLGRSHTHIHRTERGSAQGVSVADLARHAAVLGLELSVKLYPDGPPIRDVAHVALLERLKAKLGHGLAMRMEVPLPIDGDRRAWDAVILGAGEPIGVEAETRVRDIQALTRRIALKQRDAGFTCVLLVVADSRGNRRVLRAMSSVLASTFTLSSRLVLLSLAAGTRPRGSGILII